MAYTQVDLCAYIDGSASEELARSIETDMARDPDLEDRLLALDPLAEPVRNAFAEVSTPDPAGFLPASGDAGPEEQRFFRKIMPLSAAACVGALLAFGLFFMSSEDQTWRMQVANYQALYTFDTVSGPVGSDLERAQQTANAGLKIGLQDLDKITARAKDLTHVRTQILQVNGVPLVQIVFRTADGTPIALCGLPRDGSAGSDAVTVGTMAQMASAAFETEHHSWLLIGSGDEGFISENAQLFKNALQDI